MPQRLSALVCLLALCACGASSTNGTIAADSPLQLFSGSRDINGAPVAFTSNRATVVVFFATWCGPCRRELSHLGQLRAEPKLDFQIIGVNAYEEWGNLSDERRLRAFLSNHAPWLKVIPASPQLMEGFGHVPKIPTLFVFDGHGKLIASYRRNQRSLPTKAELADAVATAMRR